MTLQVSMPPAPELSNLNAEIWLNRDARLPLELSGGYGSRVSSVTGGALPAGLELNAAEAIVVGRPTQLGRFTATVTTTDEQNRKSTAQVDITVTEKPIAGVTYQYYVGAFETLPDFTTLMPMDAGVTNAISIGTIPDRNEGYALKFDGFLKITSAGSYRFFLNSDDGSRLFVADQIVIDNADGHSLAITHTGSVQLSAGYHALCLQYYQGTWDKGLTLAIEGPGVSRQNVPSSMLVFENPDTFGATPLLHPRTTTLLSKPSLFDQSDNFFLLNGARIRSPTAHSSTSVNGLVLVRKTNAAVSKKVLVK